MTRASLHNLSFIEDLELMPGNRILVSKRNMIIPHVEENMDRGGFNLEAAFPHQCPCCGQSTRIHETKGRDENGKERIIKTLFCDNAACETRKLKQFVHFVSKKAMNIEGCPRQTLEKLIGRGWIHSYLDLYRAGPAPGRNYPYGWLWHEVLAAPVGCCPAEPQHHL